MNQFATVLSFSIQLLDVQRIILYGEIFEDSYCFSLLQNSLSEKNSDQNRENIYDVVPEKMKLELKAAPLLAVSVFFNSGGYKTF